MCLKSTTVLNRKVFSRKNPAFIIQNLPIFWLEHFLRFLGRSYVPCFFIAQRSKSAEIFQFIYGIWTHLVVISKSTLILSKQCAVLVALIAFPCKKRLSNYNLNFQPFKRPEPQTFSLKLILERQNREGQFFEYLKMFAVNSVNE